MFLGMVELTALIALEVSKRRRGMFVGTVKIVSQIRFCSSRKNELLF